MMAGAYGEHQFTGVTYQEEGGEAKCESLDDCFLGVHLEPAADVTLHISMRRFVNKPSYKEPF